MEWMTKASCSGFQAGVVSKCLGTVQLCSARTSKGQLGLFEQCLLSIYRGSDRQRETDLCQAGIKIQGNCNASSAEVMRDVQIFLSCQSRVSACIPKVASSKHESNQKQGRVAFTCLGPARTPLSAGFDPNI